MMTKSKCDGYLDEIQERMDGDVFKTMLEVMARQVMEEELSLHLGATRHERAPSRRGHRNGYKKRSLKTRMGELSLEIPQARGVEPYSPMLFATAVVFAASQSFLSPIGYQTNLMVYAPGRYRFLDFFRFGWPLSLAYSLLVPCLLLWFA